MGKKGGLDLSVFTTEQAAMQDRAIWRSIYEKIESHQMPPPREKSQPSESASASPTAVERSANSGSERSSSPRGTRSR